MPTFENPSNGHKESYDSQISVIWAILFGFFYFMFIGQWLHAILYIVIIIATAVVFAPLLLIVVPATWIIYGFLAPVILRRWYLRNGWREIEEGVAAPLTDGRPWWAQNAAPLPDTRDCPYCAEPIKRAAKLCKHCGHSV